MLKIKAAKNRSLFLLIALMFLISNQAMALVSGQLIWERHFGGPKMISHSRGMALDKNNNIYIAGISSGYITTMKYNKNGEKKWTRRYKNSIGIWWNHANDIITDDASNIYTVGLKYDNLNGHQLVVIKYDTTGNQNWVRTYKNSSQTKTEAISVVIDSKKNVYVFGTAEARNDKNRSDLITIKYDSSGNRKWIRYYNIAPEDVASKISVDYNDNVYIAGYGETTFWPKYDPPYIKSSSVVIKYDSSGNQKWVKLSKGSDGFYAIKDLDIDTQGNVIAAGEDSGDLSAIKYSTKGAELWARKFNKSADGLSDLALDDEGNIYLAGDCLSFVGDKVEINFLIVKYDKDGNRRWARQLDGSGTYDDEGYGDYFDSAHAVTVGNNNAVYVTGITYGGIKRHFDFLTVKYDSTGKQRWARRFNGSKSYWDSAHDIKSESLGNVFVLGTSNNNSIGYDPYTEASSSNITLLKYAP